MDDHADHINYAVTILHFLSEQNLEYLPHDVLHALITAALESIQENKVIEK